MGDPCAQLSVMGGLETGDYRAGCSLGSPVTSLQPEPWGCPGAGRPRGVALLTPVVPKQGAFVEGDWQHWSPWPLADSEVRS